MSAEPPFPPQSWVVLPTAPGTRYRVLEVKPYQGVVCGWLARLEGYSLPWVDMTQMKVGTVDQKPPRPVSAPATPLGAPPPRPGARPAPRPVKPAPPRPEGVNPSLF